MLFLPSWIYGAVAATNSFRRAYRKSHPKPEPEHSILSYIIGVCLGVVILLLVYAFYLVGTQQWGVR